MSRLEKRAWINLGGVMLCVIIAGPGIGWMVHANTKGPVVLIPFLISGLIGGLVSYLRNIKSWTELDEREKKIAQRALVLSSRLHFVPVLRIVYCLPHRRSEKSCPRLHPAGNVPFRIIPDDICSVYVDSGSIRAGAGQ
jgi:hypothetical protein